MSEILCISRNRIFPLFTPTGFFPFDDTETALAFLQGNSFYGERTPQLESDTTTKQIIPQVCLIAEGKLFVHRIGGSEQEQRLSGLWTIFLGGHVERAHDREISDAVLREFKEEIDYRHAYTSHPLGLVNTESTEISKSHVGLVYVFHGERAAFEPTKDLGVTQGEFIALDELERAFLHDLAWRRVEDAELNEWSLASLRAVKQFATTLRSFAELRTDAERFALYESNRTITSEHWPTRYKTAAIRANAEKCRAEKIPLVVSTCRNIAARSYDVLLTFDRTGLEAEALSIRYDALHGDKTGDALRNEVERFADGYPLKEIRPS